MVPFGEGVFETLRVVDSRPFALTRHLDRLEDAARRLGLDPVTRVAAESAIARHLETHPLAFGRLRLTLYSAGSSTGLAVDSAPTPPPMPSVTLSVSTWRVDQCSPLVGLKTTDYVDYATEQRRAVAARCDDALLRNSAGMLCEATTANLFYVVDDMLRTPTLSAGCLPGIARQLVIDLCAVDEADAPFEALAAASEVFVTSSLRWVQAVGRVGDWTYPAPGPRTLEAIDAWHRLAGVTWDPTPGERPEMRTID